MAHVERDLPLAIPLGTERLVMHAEATAEGRYRLPLTLLLIVTVALVLSGIRPNDRLTWLLEVFPVLLAAPILIATAKRFPLTPLLYVLLAIHGLILILGGRYTYAQVPLGFWLQDLFDFARNPYDRIGHLAQGFIPAILAREILLRNRVIDAVKRGWLFYLVVSICLGFSAFYELIEWWAAILGGGTAEAFLGTQGDVWDTQWDMFLALVGAIVAQLLLGRTHDRQIARMTRMN